MGPGRRPGQRWRCSAFPLGWRSGRCGTTAPRKPAPSVAPLSEYHETHDAHQIRELLLAELMTEVHINEHALARRAVLFDRALTPLVLAILIDLAGRL